MREEKIAVVYVGKKPFAIDNVAGSGKAWNGSGDVQEVSAAQARTLIAYPDQWALVNERDHDAVSRRASIAVQDESGEQVDVPEDSLDRPIEKMTKPQLVAMAKSLGKELPPTLSRKEMIAIVDELVGDVKPAGSNS